MRFLCALAILAAVLGPVNTSSAGELVRPPLRQQVANADVVIFGRFENARKKDDLSPGETDFILESVVKTHPIIKDRKVVVVPRYIPIQEDRQTNYQLVFGEIRDKKLEFYRGFPADRRVVDYLCKIMKLDAKKPVAMARFFVDHLENPQETIASDAHAEVMQSPPKLRIEACRTLSTKKIWTWLRDSNIAPRRRNTYASLLAGNGDASDAAELFKMLDKEKRQVHDGFFFSILSLNSKEYLDRIKKIARDSDGGFIQPYSIMLAVRNLHEIDSTPLPERQRLELMECILDNPQTADFAVDSFRKWKRWEYTDRILALAEKKEFSSRITCRSILWFAFRSPEPNAGAYVAKMRKKDRELVDDVESILMLESEAPPPTK